MNADSHCKRNAVSKAVRARCISGLLLLFTMASSPVFAGRPEFQLVIENHLFIPAEIVIPANQKVKLVIHNQDQTPEEFESYELNREKVIMGNHKAVIFIGPLAPGEYPFFGEFHPDTAIGKVIAR